MKKITYIVSFLVTVFVAVLVSDAYHNKRLKRTVDDIELKALRRQIESNIELSVYRARINSLDSLKSLREAENKSLEKQIKTLQERRIEVRIDTMSLSGCIETVKLQDIVIRQSDSVIVTQALLIRGKDKEIEVLAEQIDLKDKEIIRVNNDYLKANKDIEVLIGELRRETTWWKKNEKWIYLGAGIIGTAGLTTLLGR